MIVARFLFVASLLLVGVGVGAYDWRAGLVVVGSMLWWDLHRAEPGKAGR